MRNVLYKDTIPYEVPSALAALRGPADGVIKLPLSVYWGPEPSVDLSSPDLTRWAYQTIVREATAEVQEELLNEGVLRSLWPALALPIRCRSAWEAAFPDLAT